MLDRIRVDPTVCEGRPTIRGLRITVEFVLKLLGDRYTAAEIVREYPELEEEDVYQAAKFGAWLATAADQTIIEVAARVIPNLENAVLSGAIVTVQDARVRVRALPIND